MKYQGRFKGFLTVDGRRIFLGVNNRRMFKKHFVSNICFVVRATSDWELKKAWEKIMRLTAFLISMLWESEKSSLLVNNFMRATDTTFVNLSYLFYEWDKFKFSNSILINWIYAVGFGKFYFKTAGFYFAQLKLLQG